MFSTLVQAHEEGVSTGSESWLGPLLFFGIILACVVVAKLILRKRKRSLSESDETREARLPEALAKGGEGR